MDRKGYTSRHLMLFIKPVNSITGYKKIELSPCALQGLDKKCQNINL